jgi:hypothetical protein
MNFVDPLERSGGDWDEDDEQISDDELTALALAADPEQEVGSDAIELPLYPGQPSGSLPMCYMPPAMAHAVGWRVPVAIGVVLAFVLIDALGMCITFGSLVGA